MVRVAVCPKCSHESVMFDQADKEEWARCPECRTHFQIKQAAAREIPQLVMTKDEALLAEEESESAKETVDSALETRWDSRRTLNAASTQTFVGSEPATSSAQAGERNVSPESSPPENGRDANRRTVSDLSSLATWSELPSDQAEAQARAEQAGDTSSQLTSETPTLPLRRSRDGDEAALEDGSPESAEESGDRFDKWFQAKATMFDFTPPTLDESDKEEADDVPRPNEAAASPSFEAGDEPEMEIDSASDDKSPDDTKAESTDASHRQDDSHVTWPPGWPQGRPNRIWSRRRRSPLRMFVMIGFGGIVGLALGYYALMWIIGPQTDFLNAAQYLPSAILPREFQPAVVKLPTIDATTIDATTIDATTIDATTIDATTIDATTIDATTNEMSAADELAPEDEQPNEQPVDVDALPPPLENGDIAAAAEAVEAASVAGTPSFSADELADALNKAKEAQAGLVTGNFDDGAEVKRTKGQSYMAFTDLAQKATFVDRSSNATQASAFEQEVQELVRTTLADAHAHTEVARLVPIWIKSTKRTHAGIFFAGHVAREEVRGAFVEWQVDMGQDSIIVFADASKALVNPPTGPVAILGWIVDNPAEQVTGYTGPAQQAVWAGHIIPLE